MTTADTLPHWADLLQLREEVVARHGHADHLQMSLFDAVYQTAEVPYREATYWCEITEPTPKLVGFMADASRRLGVADDAPALYHLDQGMGGGKSHALVGLYHMVTNPSAFFASDVGQQIATEAKQRARSAVELGGVRTVVLTADHFSPGVASPVFGPAVTLHERFLWGLFDAGRSQDGRRLYDEHARAGSDKAALKDALRAAGMPVLILLDELMDYAMQLSGRDDQAAMDAEKAFLNALLDAVDDVPLVAMVVVMISTEADEQGYEGPAGEFREYIAARLARNGTKLAVNEPQDFGAIIRRRIFKPSSAPLPIDELARAWQQSATGAWDEQVFSRLSSERQPRRFRERLDRSYPFHPDLLDLVEKDWVQHVGFQRVRSTVEIFSASVFAWMEEHAGGGWAPLLIGVGDVPLHTTADQVLSSGILHGNDRTLTALRQVAQNDITNAERTHGRAVEIDRATVVDQPWARVLPAPAVRMATALWMYSVALRAQARRGATKAELLSAVFIPDERLSYADAEETFNRLVDDEEGLGALDVIEGRGGNTPPRYTLSTTKTLRMFHRTAKARVQPDRTGQLVWERTKALATRGAAFEVMFVEAPDEPQPPPVRELFADIDQRNTNRLVVLDPRRWTLLNGRDSATRVDIEALLGVGENSLSPSYAASCIVACVNTQRRDGVQKRAREALAWKDAMREIDETSDIHDEAVRNHAAALDALDRDLKRAFQHVCFLTRQDNEAAVAFHKLEEDTDTSLSGNTVWSYLGAIERAAAGDLSGAYLHRLLDLSSRQYTLQEVVRKFWSDPTFPLVEDLNTARRAVFDALRPDEDGVAWELVTSDGEPLSPASPQELAVTSSEQYLRLRPAATAPDSVAAAEPVGDPYQQARSSQDGGADLFSAAPSAPGPIAGSAAPAPPVDVEYVWHELRLDNAALTDKQRREAIWNLIGRLEIAIDPSNGLDLQLLTMHLKLNAPKDALTELREKATDANARWDEHADDF